MLLEKYKVRAERETSKRIMDSHKIPMKFVAMQGKKTPEPPKLQRQNAVMKISGGKKRPVPISDWHKNDDEKRKKEDEKEDERVKEEIEIKKEVKEEQKKMINEEIKEDAVKTAKKVVLPFTFQNLGLVSFALCPKCVNRSRTRSGIQFPDGNYFIGFTVCSRCIARNTGILNALSK
ncbi:MAG: hypothetical protein GY820_47815 [Gammaproteobacteria bacterium]|nr:hypothetical protein [Gammaproteobacteria bacterium]